MARVKHTIIQNRLLNEMDSITWSEFSSGEAYNAYLQDIAENLSGRYSYDSKIHVSAVYDKDCKNKIEIAATDNYNLFVNTGNHYCEQYTSWAAKHELILGYLTHEVGHLLFTDFDTLNDTRNSLENKLGLSHINKLDPKASHRLISFNQYLANIKNPQILNILLGEYNHCINILEDGFINDRIIKTYPGYGKYLIETILLMQDDSPSLTIFLQKENDTQNPYPAYFTMLSLIHAYSIYGDIKVESWQNKSQRVKDLIELMELIDSSIIEDNNINRMELQNTVFLFLFPYLHKYMETMIKRYGNNAPEELRTSLDKLQDSLPGTAVPQNVATSITAQNVTKGKHNEQNADSSTYNLVSSNISVPCTSPSPENKSENNSNQNISVQSSSLLPNPHKRSPISKKSDSLDAADAVKRILKVHAAEKLHVKLEKERTSALNTYASTIKMPGIHANITCNINRLFSVDKQYIQQYNNIAPPLEAIGKKLAKGFNKIHLKKQRGIKLTNLYFGKKIETRKLLQKDGRVFSKNILPNNHSTIRVGVLLDESGSMNGDRIIYARSAAIALYAFTSELHIPTMIYGHRNGYNDQVELQSYTELEHIDNEDKYRLMAVSAGGSNRDGYAIRYMCERLTHNPLDIMLLIIISDGRPNAHGYTGFPACEDIASTVAEYRRKGVITIAAGIGDDKDTLRSIYKDNYLDITVLKDLPQTLISLVTKYI